VKDTYNTFIRNAKRYFEVGDFNGLSIEEKQKRIKKQGWMLKMGRGRISRWKERYFVLINNPMGLLYYENNPFEQKNTSEV
jgi:hypothetical protein